ncbi:hypothetical protein KIL84_014977 [Mauremys mutica]|uniref:Uncharacterized protein n=1 Tax=Mauremys mutica TaxID=74926 RepID=A0A9D3XQP1_9SAUR|nr:hypothetical protein KIL84_014977 [Mauremys mutica]
MGLLLGKEVLGYAEQGPRCQGRTRPGERMERYLATPALPSCAACKPSCSRGQAVSKQQAIGSVRIPLTLQGGRINWPNTTVNQKLLASGLLVGGIYDIHKNCQALAAPGPHWDLPGLVADVPAASRDFWLHAWLPVKQWPHHPPNLTVQSPPSCKAMARAPASFPG